MTSQSIFAAGIKRFGLCTLDRNSMEDLHSETYKQYIKVLFVPKGYQLKIDFASYTTRNASLFFVGPNQLLQFEKPGSNSGLFLYYNRDFYCIQIHDAEVACDGLLYNNVQRMPMVSLEGEDLSYISRLLEELEKEYETPDSSQEEMIRTYLKQLLIKATRIWKRQHLDTEMVRQTSELEFFRRFSVLVENYYKEKHTVADYAGLLSMAAKTITHRFKRLNLPQPNEIIKDRLMLEAKRMLIHTTLSAKEIAYELGYEDPAYFSRQFLQKTGETPTNFRRRYLD